MASDKVELDKLTLDDGRVLTLKQPSAVWYTKCVELAAGTPILIPFYEAMFCVAKIDNDAIVPPVSRLKMDALAEQIGRKNLDLLQQWYQHKLYPEIMEIQEEALEKNLSSEEIQALVEKRKIEKLKNSLKTQ